MPSQCWCCCAILYNRQLLHTIKKQKQDLHHEGSCVQIEAIISIYLVLIVSVPNHNSENYEVNTLAKSSTHLSCFDAVFFVQPHLSCCRNGKQRIMNPLISVGITHLPTEGGGKGNKPIFCVFTCEVPTITQQLVYIFSEYHCDFSIGNDHNHTGKNAEVLKVRMSSSMPYFICVLTDFKNREKKLIKSFSVIENY